MIAARERRDTFLEEGILIAASFFAAAGRSVGAGEQHGPKDSRLKSLGLERRCEESPTGFPVSVNCFQDS
jgi:hypothetical protein